jgi:hypothetical protein
MPALSKLTFAGLWLHPRRAAAPCRTIGGELFGRLSTVAALATVTGTARASG